MQETRKRVRNQTITGRLERVNICAGEAKTPSQINPLKSHHRLVRPIASCRLLNAHAGLLVHTQWELDLCPDSCTHTYAHTHTQTQIPWPRLMASSHHAKHLLGVNPQQKLGSCVCVFMRVGVWERGGKKKKSVRSVCWCVHSHSSRWWKRMHGVWSLPRRRARPLKTQMALVQLTQRYCFSSTHPHIINLLADFEVEADAKMLTNLRLSEQRDLTITFPYLAC